MSENKSFIHYILFHNIFALKEKLIFVIVFRLGQLIIDSRCYLAGGGSTESLTASEDLPVGSVIGNEIILFCFTSCKTFY